MTMNSYLQKKLVDHIIAVAAYTMPSVWLTLLQANPGASGALVSEFTGGSFARVALTAKMGAANATTGISLSTLDATFPVPTGTWGAMNYAAIMDSSVLGAGNMLFYRQIDNSKVINNGDAAPSFLAQSISVSIAGALSIALSSYLMKKLVDHALGIASYTMPTAVYHGLLASNPTIAGLFASEPGVGAYARQLAPMAAADLSTGQSLSSADIRYPTPTADYPDINYTFLADAVAAGNMLCATQLPSVLSIRNGSFPALFPSGATKLALA